MARSLSLMSWKRPVFVKEKPDKKIALGQLAKTAVYFFSICKVTRLGKLAKETSKVLVANIYWTLEFKILVLLI